MSTNIVLAHLGYILSIVMFMLGIMRMGAVRTARSGNMMAAAAMLIAVVSQFVEMGKISPWAILLGLTIGSVVGVVFAVKVQMTQMPEMVALFNGFGGLASTFVALAAYFQYVETAREPVETVADMTINGAPGGSFNAIALMLAIIIGSVTFSGSLVAFVKLRDKPIFGVKKPGQPILLPYRHMMNLGGVTCALLLAVLAVWGISGALGGGTVLVVLTLLTLALGIGLVIPIGGGDMPVVISLLNSYSGVAASMAGFAINSPVLIVSGALVGAAGLILTKIMCKAMNRSLTNVLFGGFGAVESSGGTSGGSDEYTNVKSADPEEAAMTLVDARNVVVVPGYGLAVAQAQHAVREFADLLISRGCQVRYAIHPVAGRMPGHMNVLLAEANVPYDQLYEMDQINSDFRNVDVALVIGANDVVNPAAKDNPASPIYGMPILNVHEAQTVFVVKRSLGAGFAGIKNELFEKPNTQMIYGDAKKVLEALAKELKEAVAV